MIHRLDIGPVQRITGGFAMYGSCSCGWARTAILPRHELPRGTFANPEEVLDAMLISGHSVAHNPERSAQK